MTAWYRHHPALRTSAGAPADVCWRREPALAAYRRIQFTVEDTGAQVDVPVSATPVVVDGVGVLVVSDEGCVRLFKDDLSRVFWQRRVPATLYASPVYLEDARQFVIASQGGHVAALDLLGEVRWLAEVDQPIYGSPAVDVARGALYVTSFGQRLFGFDLATGALRWRAELPAPWAAAIGSPQAARDPYASPVIDGDGNVYVTSAEHVNAFDPGGRRRWRLDTGATLRASPAVDDATRTCVAASVAGELWLIDLGSRSVRHRVVTGGKLLASPAIGDGVAFVGTEQGRILAVDLVTGAPRWSREVGHGLDHGSLTVTPPGDVVCVTAAGNALCLDAASGAFVWETSQVVDEPDHDRRLNGTPVIAPSGVMMATSYAGFVYQFRFRSRASVDHAREGRVVVA